MLPVTRQTINELEDRIKMLEEENSRMQTALLLALTETNLKKSPGRPKKKV